ncbi:hypothetical protein QNI19_01045 [Cytophagaceae bacterium DM2B3-1]|uniref:Response regulatory domain-containing protein n=1 Tax=Xanthocytophaga flava TaxID=3048013 RepID=A0ABT7CCX1_9BACT|nr:hypothetical protein [Xanthocytophaga flavus]MDJ1491493.1 hypothetical protein [Xanthocytophaga flavus]
MNLLLSLRIGAPIPQYYQNSTLDLIKQEAKDLIIYDCDNHSDSVIISYAADLLEKSAKAAIIIEMEQEGDFPLGQLRLLFTKLIQHTTKILLVTVGTHPVANHILQALPATIQFHNLDNPKQVKQILSFLDRINEQ